MNFFKAFITDEMLEIIVEQSNLYVVKNDPSKPLGLTKPELERWLGILINF